VQGDAPEYSREEWLKEKFTLGLEWPNVRGHFHIFNVYFMFCLVRCENYQLFVFLFNSCRTWWTEMWKWRRLAPSLLTLGENTTSVSTSRLNLLICWCCTNFMEIIQCSLYISRLYILTKFYRSREGLGPSFCGLRMCIGTKLPNQTDLWVKSGILLCHELRFQDPQLSKIQRNKI